MSERAPEAPEYLEQTTVSGRRDALLETVRQALEDGDPATLRLVLNSQHPADLAELLRWLGEEDKARVLDLVSEPLAARSLAELDSATVAQVASGIDEEVLSDLVEGMAPDDAADVLADLPEAQSERLLDLMPDEDAREVRELMTHAEDTGGGIMTSRLVAVRESSTVAEAVASLREWAEEDDILTIFVVDGEYRLRGTVPLRRLILARPDSLIGDLQEPEPIGVRPETDQEEIAALFREYDLLVLPVVDEAGRLVGQVTVDDVVDVIHEEAVEDLSKMAALGSAEGDERSILGAMRRRLPWLLLCLTGTLVSGGVLHLFSGALAAAASLLLFVPAIMAMGGNSGIQTATVTVRSLATGYSHATDLRRALWREMRVAAAMGSCLGLVVYAAGHLWVQDARVAECAGAAMAAAVILSALLGAVVPLLFRALHIDPAVASGPLITTLNDVLSLLIYFSIAAGLLDLWG